MSTSQTPAITLDLLQQYLEDSPFQLPFKLRAVSFDVETGMFEVRLASIPFVERASGTRQIHGGAIASLIDIAGDFALFVMLGHGVPTINLRIDYLRPAIETDLTARAMVRKAGRNIGVVDIDVVDSVGKLVAVGRGTYGTQSG
jgi:uncharacterized protein (TIGR00369 family)